MKMLDTVRAAFRHPLFNPLCAIIAILAASLVIAPEIGFALPLAVGAVLTETKHTAAFIVSEANGTRSRSTVTVTVPADTTFLSGSVLGKITATGKYVLYDNAAADGSEVAAAILYTELVNDTVGAVDNDAVVIDIDAEVRSADLTWKDAGHAAAGLVDLRTLGIKAR